MNAGCKMLVALTILFAFMLLNVHCQKNDGEVVFVPEDLYGKWKCYKIYTYWKSMPDSIRVTSPDSLDFLYRITQDSIVNYVKTAPASCYTKSSMAVAYTTDDTVASGTDLIVQAYQNTIGITLKYYYRTADSITEYCLQKIENSMAIDVCDFGNTLLKTTAGDRDGMGETRAVIRSGSLTKRKLFNTF
jgi:hypothetical protein